MTTRHLPNAFIVSITDQLGPAASAFLATYDAPPCHGLRVNPAKTTLPVLREHTGWALTAIPWCPDGGYVDPADHPGSHPYHAAGVYYLQEPSAMAVAEFAGVRPGMTVLDLAASPGGKSTQLASAIGPTGLLVSNEIHPGRIKALGENLERWGVANTAITNRTPAQLSGLGPVFDRVVVDAPCSGEGLFRRDPGARCEWSPERVLGCAERQIEILGEAVRLVRAGGALIYSTCTFNRIENEQVLDRILSVNPDFRLDAHQRLWPHEVLGEGHTMARLVREGETSGDWSEIASSPGYRGDAWRRFVSESLHVDPAATSPGNITERGGRLDLVPNHPVAASLGQTVRAGLWLGDIKPGRFEPSHALALALDPEMARNRLDLTVAQAQAWISGAPMSAAGAPGWVLITVDGYGLGWGKRTGDTVKNRYPKGLRR